MTQHELKLKYAKDFYALNPHYKVSPKIIGVKNAKHHFRELLANVQFPKGYKWAVIQHLATKNSITIRKFLLKNNISIDDFLQKPPEKTCGAEC